MIAYVKTFLNRIFNDDFLFFCIVFFSIFNFIPEILQLNLIGANCGSKLSFYFLIILFLKVFYYQHKNKNFLVNFNIFRNWFLAYITIALISLIIGIYSYPFYQEIIEGPLYLSGKIIYLLEIFKNLNFNISENVLFFYYHIFWILKGCLLASFWTLCGAYIIYCLYWKNWQKAFNIINTGILAAVFVIIVYSIIEIFYLSDSLWATKILICINPYLHVIEVGYGWWPPLLLKGQLRSIFAEPSNIGLWFSFASPFLWYKIIMTKKQSEKLMLLILWSIVCFISFLTNSRTVLALFLIENLILLFYAIYFKNKNFLYDTLTVILVSVIMIFSANYFIQNCFVDNTLKINSIEKYMEVNLNSLNSTNQRSNLARYSVALANIKIGLENPFLGVGYGLTNGYIRDALPEMALNSKEVKMWLKQQEEKGILKSGFPRLCEYTSRFAETGLIGLLTYFLPCVYLFYKLKNIVFKSTKFENKLPYIMFSISLFGVLISGFSAVLDAFFCYWILLGLGYAMCFGKENDIKTDDYTSYK